MLGGAGAHRAAWSDAADGDQAEKRRCRLRSLIALPPSALRGLCHVPHWSSCFVSWAVKRSLEGEVYAFGELVDHMDIKWGFYTSFLDVALLPGCRPHGPLSTKWTSFLDVALRMVGMGVCEGLTEKCLIRYFSSIQKMAEGGDLAKDPEGSARFDIFRLPRPKNPADPTLLHRGILSASCPQLSASFTSGSYKGISPWPSHG